MPGAATKLSLGDDASLVAGPVEIQICPKKKCRWPEASALFVWCSFLQEMKAHDLKRLETMKSVLRSYAESRRNLVAKALQVISSYIYVSFCGYLRSSFDV